MAKISRRSLFTLAGSAASAVACKTVGGSQTSNSSQEEYDYIVVGSGAGGGPLAVNLAKAGFNVLLIEAGSDQGEKTVYRTPKLHTQSSEDPDMSWDFWVKHYDKDDLNRKNRNYRDGKGLLYPRAGTVGGCTAHNAMINVYPLARDWTEMANEVGDSSYDPVTMRKYFQLWEKAEYISDPNRQKGWLSINTATKVNASGDKVLRANILAANRCLKKNVDSSITDVVELIEKTAAQDTNAEFPGRDTGEALVTIPIATRGGHRNSTREYILSQVGKNLTLRTNCLVSRVIFEGSDKPRAIGVEYLFGNRIYTAAKNPEPKTSARYQVKARREVILAGGTFNTPQILMASGIGPAEDLKKFEGQDPNYKVILNRPGVGRNLQDRYEIGVVSSAKEPLETSARCAGDLLKGCLAQAAEGEGSMTSNGVIFGVLKKSTPSLPYPDLFIFLLAANFSGYHPNYSKEISANPKMFTWAVLKSHTQNRGGQVKIKSLDPTETPDINFHYYEEGTDANFKSYRGDTSASVEDLEAVVSGIEFVRSVVNDAGNLKESIDKGAELPAAFNAKPNMEFEEQIPGPSVKTRADIREWARRNSWGHHACGSCKMGKADDPMAVVDSKFRVIGTENLRIVDASIFPRIPGFFIVSSVYTISERATDEVLADAGLPRRINV